MAEFEMEEVGKGIKKVGQVIAKNPLLLAGVVAGGGVLIWSLFLRNGRGQADPLHPQPLHAGLPRQVGGLPVRGAPPRAIPREGREPLPAADLPRQAGGLPVTTPSPPVASILPAPIIMAPPPFRTAVTPGPFLPADALTAYVRRPQPTAIPYIPMPVPRTQPIPFETIMPYLDPGEVRPGAVRRPYIPILDRHVPSVAVPALSADRQDRQDVRQAGWYRPEEDAWEAPVHHAAPPYTPMNAKRRIEKPSAYGGPSAAGSPYIPAPPPRTQPIPWETIMPYIDPGW